MTTESSSGMDELMRLSQQFKKQEHDITQREKQIARQREKSQDVFSELRALSISTAIRQLQPVATPEIIKQVNSLKSKQDSTELLKLIDNLVYDLEKRISVIAIANPDLKPIEQSVKTLTILLGLLSSLSN